MKRLVAFFLAAMLLSFGVTAHAEVATQPPTDSSISQTEAEGAKATPISYPWGKASDPMKTYEDHYGTNGYADYIITGALGYRGQLSYAEVLPFERLGSGYLTTLQEQIPLNEHPELPTMGCFARICITDKGQTYQYYFYEDDDIFTVQNGKMYYLGKHPYLAYNKIMSLTFRYAYDHTQICLKSDFPPPAFDDSNVSMKNTATVEDLPALKRTYSPEDYQVAVTFTSYGDNSQAIVLNNMVVKKWILAVLENAWEVKERKLLTHIGGRGHIIQVYNENECYNFQIGDNLTNYQVDNDTIQFKLPSGFSGDIQMVVAREVAARLVA